MTLDGSDNWIASVPGHPEYRWTSGVETTTGPLGQGVATSVGMAIAAKWEGAYFNRPGFDLFDYNVYALCGDGCIMEGVTSEAASLAGHLNRVATHLAPCWTRSHPVCHGLWAAPPISRRPRRRV